MKHAAAMSCDFPIERLEFGLRLDVADHDGRARFGQQHNIVNTRKATQPWGKRAAAVIAHFQFGLDGNAGPLDS